MAITLQQAAQVAGIYQQIQTVQGNITEVQAAIGANVRAQHMAMDAVDSAGNGYALKTTRSFSVEATNAILSGLFAVFEAELAALQAQLAAIGS